MYSTCLHRTRDLGRNEMVETLPIGRRLAFDAEKGRLWVVCSSCAKWNLVPFDTRLESIDACERLFRGSRTRYSTDNIGMAKVGDGLTLVRVGRALRPEFASWRYGEQYRKRRRNAVAVAGVGGVAVVGAVLGLSSAVGIGVGGFSYMLFHAGQEVYNGILNRRAQIRTIHPDKGELVTFAMPSLKESALVWDGGETVLRVPPSPPSMLGSVRWVGRDVPAIGRRVAAGLNLTVGRKREIGGAVEHLAVRNGDLNSWLHEEAGRQRQRRAYGKIAKARAMTANPTDPGSEFVNLAEVRTEQRLALEMWFSEDIERRWLEGELRFLEREWRDAEKLAKIADDLVLEDGG